MTSTLRLIGRRLIRAASTLFVVSFVLFAAVEVLPGDAARRSLGPYASEEQVDALRAQMGLDRSFVARYASWIGNALTGDLGESLVSRRPVGDIVGDRLGNTLLLAAGALLIVAIVAVAGGVWTGARPGKPADVVLSASSTFVIALPEFVTASVLIAVFAWQLNLLPPLVIVPAGASILDRPSALILPLASVSLLAGAAATRLVRAVVIDASKLPHVEAARLQGLPERTVLRRHLLPTVLGPTVQVMAFIVPYLVGGTVIVEYIFNYPGLANVLVSAVAGRDAPVVEGIGLVLAAFTIGAFAAADVVGILANPRLRTAGR